MKKQSGFEKFMSKEKKGGAKKEAIRQEKRKWKKEQSDKIEERKRQARAARTQGGDTWGRKPEDGQRGPARSFKPRDEAAGTNRREDEKRPQKNFSPRKQDRPGAKRTDAQPSGAKRSFTPRKQEGGDKNFERKERPQKARSFDKREGQDQRGGKKPFAKGPAKSDRSQKPQARKAAPARRFGGENNQVIDKSRQLPADHEAKTKPTIKKSTGEQMPLNKYIAHGGLCSRRDAVTFIKSGKVKVNNELVLEPGYKVLPTDTVSVAGRKIHPVNNLVYILLNKPKDYITTTDDPQDRKTVLDLLGGATTARIYPVGRLDRNTSGVLLLTNDGELAQKLTHPSNEIKKVYAVTLDKPLTKKDFEAILKGVELEDGPATVDVLAYADPADKTQIGVEIHSGRNRIVRRIFEHLGYDVRALDRVTFAGLTKKNVNRGKWRFLTEKEVRDLKFFKKGR